MEEKPVSRLWEKICLPEVCIDKRKAAGLVWSKPPALVYRLRGCRMVVKTITRCLKCGHTLRYGSLDPLEGHYYWCSNPECRDGPYGPYAMPITKKEFERGEHDPMYPVRKAISDSYGPRPCELASGRVLRGLPDRTTNG